MSAEKVIFALLEAHAPLITFVADRIYAGSIPQDSTLPAIAYDHVSTIELTTIDANSEYALVSSRIQVTVATKDYPQLKNIISLIRKACNYKRGTINGVIVNSITRELIGPDFKSEDQSLYFQTIDFKVLYHEAN